MTTPLLTGFDFNTIRISITLAGYAYVAGLPEDFDYPTELRRFGPLVPQYGGALVRDVKPNPAISDTVVSSANMAELTPHTEWYEFPGPPPRYVALWCMHSAEGPGGETTVADGYRLLAQHTTREWERLLLSTRTWRSRPTLAREGIQQVVHHPIIECRGLTVLLRFSTLDMTADDELSQRWIDHGRAFFERSKIPIKIERGGLLVWDNWRMLHARNAFTDPRRHLRRALIAHQ
jgi:alpha-ketoglutarate-dependent taurine dioxygenase